MKPRAVLVSLLALALGLRILFFFGGVRGSDAYLYSENAWDVATGRYSILANTRSLGLARSPSADEVARDVARLAVLHGGW